MRTVFNNQDVRLVKITKIEKNGITYDSHVEMNIVFTPIKTIDKIEMTINIGDEDGEG